MTRSFKQASDRLNKSKQEKYPLIPGFLGFMVNGVETVEVPTRPGYVFVRLRGVTNEVISAFNDEVSPVYNLPVLVTRDDVDNTRYRIVARDTGVYINWGGASSYLPRHGDSHSFSGEAGTGGDIVWVYGRQMMPLAVVPSGTSGAGCVSIMEGVYYQAGAWKYAGKVTTENLLVAKPAVGDAIMMLIYLDENGDPGIATGTVFAEGLSGTSDIIQYLPNLISNYHIPLAGIRLTSTTTAINWGEIYDLRPWIVGDGFVPTGTFASSNASYVTLGNTTDLTAERRLVAGDGISIVDGGANSTVTISFTGTVGGGGGGGDLLVYDNNTFVATGTALHFNDNLTVVATGTSVWIDGAAGGGGSGGGIVVYDNSTYKITGTALSFDTGLDVSVTGSTAYINSSVGSNINKIIRTNNSNTTTYEEYAKSDAGLTAALADRQQYDIIQLPAGDYNIDDTDISDVTLVGSGEVNTTLYVSSNGAWGLRANNTRASNPYSNIRDMTVLVDSTYIFTGSSTQAGGVFINYGTIENVHIEAEFQGRSNAFTGTAWIGLYVDTAPDLGTYFDRPTVFHNVSVASESTNNAWDSNADVYGMFIDKAAGLILDTFDVYVSNKYGNNAVGFRLDNAANEELILRNGRIYVERIVDDQENNAKTIGISANNLVATLDNMRVYVNGCHNAALTTTSTFIYGVDVDYSDLQYVPNIKNSYIQVFANTADATGIGTVALLRSVGPINMVDSYGLIKYDNSIANKPNPYYLYPYDGGYGTPRFRISNCGFDTKNSASPYEYIEGNSSLYNSTFIDYYDTHFSYSGTSGGGSSTSAGTLSIFEDDIFVATGTAIHFRNSLNVLASGTSVWVDGGTLTYPSGTSLWIDSDTNIVSAMENYSAVYADAYTKDVTLTIKGVSATDGYRIWIHRRDGGAFSHTLSNELITAGQFTIDAQYTGAIEGMLQTFKLKNRGSAVMVYDGENIDWKIESLFKEDVNGTTYYMVSGTSGNIYLSDTAPANEGYVQWTGNTIINTWWNPLDIIHLGSSGTAINTGDFEIRCTIAGEEPTDPVLDLSQTLKFKLIDSNDDSVIAETATLANMSDGIDGFFLFKASIDTAYTLVGNLRLELWARTDIWNNPRWFRLKYGVANKKSRVSYPAGDTSLTGATGETGPVGPPGSNTLLIYNDSVFKATGTAISFDDGLRVSTTGSIAYINSGIKLISEQSPTSTTVTWDNIPAGFSSLKVELMGRTDKASVINEGINIYYNNDTTATNYYRQTLVSVGTSVSAIAADTATAFAIPASTATANYCGASVLELFDYDNTTFHKTAYVRNGRRDDATNAYTQLQTLFWENTAAITRIDLVTATGGNFVAGTKARLYGIY